MFRVRPPGHTEGVAMVQLDFSSLAAKPKMAPPAPNRRWLAVAVSMSIFALLAAMVMVAGQRQPVELEVCCLHHNPSLWLC
jgi:hypothetical protein